MEELTELSKPRLFLDVDGVLNIWPPRTKTEWPDARIVTCGPGTMKVGIFHSVEMGRRLAALDVEIHWLTSWSDHANEWIGPLFGWAELPVVGNEFHQSWYSEPWWKLEYMKSEVHDRPFIWVDDEINDAAVEWAESENLHIPKLLVKTATHLTPQHLDEIEAWVKKITC